MNCPYCGKEMKRGIIDIDTNGNYFEQKFISDTEKPDSPKKKIAKRLLGVYAPRDSNINDCAEAYCCETCRIVLGVFPLKGESRWGPLY